MAALARAEQLAKEAKARKEKYNLDIKQLSSLNPPIHDVNDPMPPNIPNENAKRLVKEQREREATEATEAIKATANEENAVIKKVQTRKWLNKSIFGKAYNSVKSGIKNTLGKFSRRKQGGRRRTLKCKTNKRKTRSNNKYKRA